MAKLRLRTEIESRLSSAGLSAARAAELSESSVEPALEQIEKEFQEWDREEVPRPFQYGSNASILLGQKNDRYTAGLPTHFFDVLKSVSYSDERRLLGMCALFCASLGCDRIFICDKGGGDSGVDVLARRRGRFSVGHAVFAVQAKALAQPMDRLQVETVANRFRLGLDEPNWKEYRRAAAVSDLQQSPANVFVLLASKGLSDGGAEAARLRGIMSNSPRQVAFALTRLWTSSQIEYFCNSIPFTRDLERNLAHEVPPCAIA